MAASRQPTATWPTQQGAAAARVREIDWEATPLGAIARWPSSLRFAVDACLDAALPTIVYWGDALIQIHNDAASALFGDASGIGRPIDERANGFWYQSAGVVERVFESGTAARRDGELVYSDCDGTLQSAVATVAFTPLRDDTGAVAGVGVIAVEAGDRAQIQGLRNSATLQAHDMRELRRRERSMMTDFGHRTRNLLGVVQSITEKTARHSGDMAEFRGDFRDRLGALARVHAMLARLGARESVTFDQIVEAELLAIAGEDRRITLDGPRGVRLESGAVQMLAMAIHELAANAAKFGALAQDGAHLAVTWSLDDSSGAPTLHVDWRESGVTVDFAAMTHQGQVRELIDRGLPYQLGATTHYDLTPHGVTCSIDVATSGRRTASAHV